MTNIAHASERVRNSPRSHCSLGPFWNVLDEQLLPFRSRTVPYRTDPFTLSLVNEKGGNGPDAVF